VLAHELAHVKNRDTLTMTITATLAGAVTMVARMAGYSMMFAGRRSDDDERGGSALGGLLMIIVAPLAAAIIQFAISRAREFQADASGAEIVHKSRGLVSALQKLEAAAQAVPMDASPATAHLFIVNPLRGQGGLSTLFSTHPPIEERIARLRAMTL
jgi:heat shock protein HtpX